MTTPNKTPTLSVGTRFVVVSHSLEVGVAPTKVWLTLTETASWDDADWWKAVADNGDSLWIRADSEVFKKAVYAS